MPALAPFTPGATVILAVTGTTGTASLSTTHGDQIRVASPATNSLAFIRFGTTGVVATVNDLPILPGTVEVFTILPGATLVAGIGTTGTNLYFTGGDGE